MNRDQCIQTLLKMLADQEVAPGERIVIEVRLENGPGYHTILLRLPLATNPDGERQAMWDRFNDIAKSGS